MELGPPLLKTENTVKTGANLTEKDAKVLKALTWRQRRPTWVVGSGAWTCIVLVVVGGLWPTGWASTPESLDWA
jgi:hypothetical protein